MASGFLFPKRDAFNLPSPNSFRFPSQIQGKQSAWSVKDGNQIEKRFRIWNTWKPRGIFFHSVPPKTR